MAAYKDLYAASIDLDFQGRCMVAAWVAAFGIIAEATNTANHADRLDWANKALRGSLIIKPQALAVQVLQSSAVNSVTAPIATNATDSDIQAQLNLALTAIIKLG